MTNEPRNTNPFTTKTRRWFRFRLRTLLVMVTLVSVPLGWELDQRRREKVVVAWVEKMGGQADFLSVDVAHRNWWEKTKDRWFGDTVLNVDLYNRKLKIDLSPLAELKKLESLCLTETQMSDLLPLAEMKSLNYFYLNGNRVQDAIAQVYDISPLAELKNLKHLCIHNAEVNDLSSLAELKNLEVLTLTETPVNDLAPLAELKSLKNVTLINPSLQISEEQVQELRLALPNCQIVIVARLIDD